ncbi:methyltransferase domain-containing protein [Algoriphagus kandeliae]|uniref:Methyltransferase domain-containing protein n=1 Tax=Algoriphagus kandeliae TaxID=2562278 RepID=A0A4Y9QYY4_9BACT|nr:methyltransferase domain-containing protein [Algoriphagus kandeliae]TFV97260.1 methyltransferase domain-containing protein [Algoriphagus kandeliae]
MNYIHTSDIHNLNSPNTILPILFEIFKPKSILDVGCGIGTWLKSSSNLGVLDILGIDGEYVNRDLLLINEESFRGFDLNFEFNLNRQFDLILCLEVAEHLSESSSNVLINSLVKHSNVILFSAAIPGQGGQNHLNEQWPVYWVEKFSKHGFVFLDIIRPIIWDNPQIDFWYKQNIFLVVKESHELAAKFKSSSLSLVHPELYDAKNQIYEKRIAFLERQLKVHPLKRWIKSLIQN